MLIINVYRPIEITNIFIASIRFQMRDQTGQWKYIWKKEKEKRWALKFIQLIRYKAQCELLSSLAIFLYHWVKTDYILPSFSCTLHPIALICLNVVHFTAPSR